MPAVFDVADVRFPSLEGMRAFEAVARLGDGELAADELGITEGALSKRLATLEDLLGVPLLSRYADTLALTAAGDDYLDRIRPALALLTAVPQHRWQAQRVFRLRVSAPPTFARRILVPALGDFAAVWPGVEVEVVLSLPQIDGGQADADVEIRAGDAAAAGVAPLMDDLLVPVAAPALLARLPAMMTPADLFHAPLLCAPIEPWTPWLRAAGLDGHEPAGALVLADLGALMEAAVSGAGVALVRPSLARHWLMSGALQVLFDVTARPANLYYAITHTGLPQAVGFTDWLARMAAEVAVEAGQELFSAGGAQQNTGT